MKYLVFFSLLLHVGCTPNKLKKISRTQVAMGTFCTITINDKKQAEQGFKQLKKLENILSSYQANAQVSILNTQGTIPSHPILLDIFKKSKDYYEQTQGYFDITIGSITKKLYRFGNKERIPTREELMHAPLGIKHIVINKKTIHLKNDITIDLGGIGKGYSVDYLSNYFKHQGIITGQIALSGDIRCLSQCEVSIQDPFENNKIIATLTSKKPNLSISTSGTYRRYIKNKKYHHLINPKTATQGKSFISVSLLTYANNTKIDAYSTAISVMSEVEALEFLKKHTEIGYILILNNGEVIHRNLNKFVNVSWTDTK